MDCEKCISVSITNYKAAIAGKNRTILLLFILLIVHFVGTMAYVIVDKVIDSQYEIETEDIRVISEESGDANYIGGDGDIKYGSDID